MLPLILGLVTADRDVSRELSRLGPRCPLITPEHVVAFGFHPAKIYPAEQKILEGEKFLAYPAPAVLGRVPGQARPTP